MVGKGRHRLLGLTSTDPVLSVVAPVGLAASAGSALIVDLVSGVRHGRTLRTLVDEGPTRAELSPGRAGIALLRGGRIEDEEAAALVEELSSRWPAVVVGVRPGSWPFPVVPVQALYPGRLLPPPRLSNCVWQPVATGASPPGPGPVLPRLRGAAVRRILGGGLPRASRWVRAWDPVWEMPWD